MIFRAAWIAAFLASAAVAEPRDVLLIGDSYLAIHAETGQSLADVLARDETLRITSAARTGARLSGGEGAVTDQYRPGPWDVVILSGGGNDLIQDCGCFLCHNELGDLVSEDGRSGALADLVRRAAAEGAQVIYVTYPRPASRWTPFSGCRKHVATLNTRLAALAADQPAFAVVETGALFEGRSNYYHSDRYHPSPEGVAAIGAALETLLATVSD